MLNYKNELNLIMLAVWMKRSSFSVLTFSIDVGNSTKKVLADFSCLIGDI